MELLKLFPKKSQNIQRCLFHWLENAIGELTDKHRQLISVLDLTQIADFIHTGSTVLGRPPKERTAIACAFVAKVVYNMPTTRSLIDRLETDVQLRQICGYQDRSQIPSESTFSRAFAEFSETQLPTRIHAALVQNNLSDAIVGHISRGASGVSDYSSSARAPAR